MTLPDRWLRAGALALLLALGAAFLTLKLYALRPQPNDDGIYLYAAARLAEGAVLYRDVWHAHPPLHVLPTAGLFWLVGASFVAGKLLVFVLAALSGVCAFVCVRRLLRDRAPPVVIELSAIAAAALLLFSETFLVASSDDTGLVQGAAYLALAATLCLHGRALAGGALAGVALMTSLQAAPLVLVLLAAAAARPAAWRFHAPAAALVVVVSCQLIGWWWGGSGFFRQVYLYHLAKVAIDGEGPRQLGLFAEYNAVLVTAAAAGLAVLALAGPRWRRLALVLGLALGASLFTLATAPRLFFWYFVPTLFPCALAAGTGLGVAATLADRRLRRGVLAGLALLLLAACLQRPDRLGLPSPHRAPYGRLASYHWSDAPGLGRINDLVRRWFWQQGQRQGVRHNLVTEYLWRQSTWLDTFPALVQAARAQAADGQATLFGDYATAPLVALAANLRIAGDLADTTAQRFLAGQETDAHIQSLLAGQPGSLVLLRPSGAGVNQRPEFLRHVRAGYRKAAEYTSRSGTHHQLWVRAR